MRKWVNKKENNSDILLLHHRYPTSTINEKKAAHPFNTGDYFGSTKYILAHNGVIRNSKELKKEHEKLGIRYQSVLSDGTFNDSESLLWDFALTIEGKQREMKATGDMAIICMKLKNNKPIKLLFGKNSGRPLKMDRSEIGLFLSSEGEGEDIDTDTLYSYYYKNRRLYKKDMTFTRWQFAYQPTKTYTYNKQWSSYNDSHNISNVCNDNNSINYDDDSVVWGDILYRYNRRTGEYDEYDEYLGNGWYKNDYGKVAYDENYDLESDFDLNPNSDGDLIDIIENQKEDGLEIISSTKSSSNMKKLGDIIGSKDFLPTAPLSEEPTVGEVDRLMFRELGLAKGYYSMAYWSLEAMYYDLEPYTQSDPAAMWLAKLISAVIDKIQSDGNYISENSRHPMWPQQGENKGQKQLRLIGA